MEVNRLMLSFTTTVRRTALVTLGCVLFALGGCAGLPRKTPPTPPPETALRRVAHDIARQVTAAGKRRIAVVNFVDINGKITAFGPYIAENLTTHLVATHQFDVVERTLLAQLLAEHSLALSALAEPAAAQTLGRLAGADAIVSGTYAAMDGHIQIHVRVIAVETGDILAATSANVARDASTEALLGSASITGDTRAQRADGTLASIHVYRGDLAVGETGPSAAGGIEIQGIGGRTLLSAWGKDVRGTPVPISPTWSTNLPEIIEITPTVGPQVTLRALRTTLHPIELYVEQDGIKRTYRVFVTE